MFELIFLKLIYDYFDYLTKSKFIITRINVSIIDAKNYSNKSLTFNSISELNTYLAQYNYNDLLTNFTIGNIIYLNSFDCTNGYLNFKLSNNVYDVINNFNIFNKYDYNVNTNSFIVNDVSKQNEYLRKLIQRYREYYFNFLKIYQNIDQYIYSYNYADIGWTNDIYIINLISNLYKNKISF